MPVPFQCLLGMLLGIVVVTFNPWSEEPAASSDFVFLQASAVPQVLPPGGQDPRKRGLKVTYSPLDPEQRREEGEHSYRADFLSIDVQRGEAPTPMMSPGMFTARFQGVLPLNVRDRYRFQVQGRGTCKLIINGETVLSGKIRPGKPLEVKKAIRLKKGDNQIAAEIESSGTGEARLRVLWSSSDFAFEPIAPELWEWAAGDAEITKGEQLRDGHQLFVEHRCARCHKPTWGLAESAYSELDQLGPDLRSAGARLHSGWVAKWLRDPSAVIPDARMPRFAAEKDSDYDDVAAWLATLGSPLESKDAKADAEVVENGEMRFRELGCVACHIAPGEDVDDDTRFNRLSLAFVGEKWVPEALERYLQSPRADRAHSRMPDFQLSGEDAKALATFLLVDAKPPTPARGDPDRGRRLAQKHGCASCHSLQLPEQGTSFRELSTLEDDGGCLSGADGAPDFGFDKQEVAALQAFLPHALRATRNKSPLDYAARLVPVMRCTNCHAYANEASVWSQLAEYWSEEELLPPEEDPIAQGIPALTWVGSKLQPNWMERFVTGREDSPRPWLYARMPVFEAHGATIVAGLARAHGYPSVDEPDAAADVTLAASGAKLVKMGEGFGCVQCHGVGDKPPVQVFERQGVNFDVAAARLRKEYYMRWLLDPPRIDPDSRMPKYADAKGKTAFTEVLSGEADQQFDAIWHYFRTLR